MLAYILSGNRTGIAQAKPESRKHFKQSEEELALSFADISPNYCKYGYETYMNR